MWLLLNLPVEIKEKVLEELDPDDLDHLSKVSHETMDLVVEFVEHKYQAYEKLAKGILDREVAMTQDEQEEMFEMSQRYFRGEFRHRLDVYGFMIPFIYRKWRVEAYRALKPINPPLPNTFKTFYDIDFHRYFAMVTMNKEEAHFSCKLVDFPDINPGRYELTINDILDQHLFKVEEPKYVYCFHSIFAKPGTVDIKINNVSIPQHLLKVPEPVWRQKMLGLKRIEHPLVRFNVPRTHEKPVQIKISLELVTRMNKLHGHLYLDFLQLEKIL